MLVGDDQRDGTSTRVNGDAWEPEIHQGARGGAEPDRPPATIVVVSWNIQFGREIEVAGRELRAFEQLAVADIVLLQEMDELASETIAQTIGFHHVFASSGRHSRTGRHFGNAVLSRWPLRDPEIVVLPHKSAVQGQNRIAVRATVACGGTEVDACSVHTEVPSLSPPKRRRQFDALSHATQRWTPHRLVVGGDFNTLTTRGVDAVAERMQRIGAAHVSAAAGATLRRGRQEFALDHIFARGLAPLDAGVVHATTASDHRPLWVRFTL